MKWILGRGAGLLIAGLMISSCGKGADGDDEIVDTSLNDPVTETANNLAELQQENDAPLIVEDDTARPQQTPATRQDDFSEDYYEGEGEDDEAAQSTSVEPTEARVLVPLHQLFTADDYPSDAVRNEDQGRVRVTLLVGSDGRVMGCSVVESSGSSSLDNATCRILRSRARFSPARGANGQATLGTFTQTITWTLTG